MKVEVIVERNVSELATIEVDDLGQLEELARDPEFLYEFMKEQQAEYKEVIGEVLFTEYHLPERNKSYTIDDEGDFVQFIKESM